MDELTLLDWKRRIFELYAEMRADRDPEHAWQRWRETRDELFRAHPQSPIPAGASVRAAPLLRLRPGAARARHRRAGDARDARHRDLGRGALLVHPLRARRFELAGEEQSLDLYWLDGYGGGIYLCFADGTSGSESYGAGRYLLDTVKGSDLGERNGKLVLDFNFAYNPSCSYDPRWVCPLAPPGNTLAAPVRGGERYPITG